MLPEIEEYSDQSEFNASRGSKMQRRQIDKEGDNVYDSQQFEELR